MRNRYKTGIYCHEYMKSFGAVKTEMSRVKCTSGRLALALNFVVDFFTRHTFFDFLAITMIRLVVFLLAAFATHQATAAPCNACGTGNTMTGSGGSFSDGAGTFFSCWKTTKCNARRFTHSCFLHSLHHRRFSYLFQTHRVCSRSSIAS